MLSQSEMMATHKYRTPTEEWTASSSGKKSVNAYCGEPKRETNCITGPNLCSSILKKQIVI